MPTWGPLKQWFKDHGFFVKMRGNERDKRLVTHLLLDGGKIHIPETSEEEFLVQYAKAVEFGNALYVVETKTPIYKFMMDLDFAASVAVSEEEIDKVVKIVHETVAVHFPALTDSQRRVVVCRTDNKAISKQLPPDPERDKGKPAPSVNLIKTGIHLIWPEIFVHSEMALALRGAVIYRLTEKLGQRDGINPWSDVVDRCVYVGNGLRMVGSRKMSICTKCRNNPKKREACSFCGGEGRKDEGRVYLPTLVLQGEGANAEALARLDDILELVKQTSIRTALETSTLVTYPPWTVDIPVVDQEDLYSTEGTDGRKRGQKRRRRAEKSNDERRSASEPAKFCKNILPAIDPSDRRHRAVAAFIKKTFPHNPDMTHLHPTRRGDYYLARSSSRFCMNKGGYHNNTNVYFYIDRNGVRQKCFCTCNVVRKFGLCAKYASTPQSYSAQLCHLLWPDLKRSTLQSWNRREARVNKEQWLEDCIQRDLDYYREKGVFEQQFFKKKKKKR